MEAPEEEWMLTMHMGIDEVRMLYDHICYSIKIWPGPRFLGSPEPRFLGAPDGKVPWSKFPEQVP